MDGILVAGVCRVLVLLVDQGVQTSPTTAPTDTGRGDRQCRKIHEFNGHSYRIEYQVFPRMYSS